MKYQDVTRFEFRIFGTDLTAVRETLAALAPGAELPKSRETYIVTRLNVESNVKIRADRLEVKGLQGRLRLLEQWQPIYKSQLPVPADDIENIVAPALGVDVELGAAPLLTEAALVVFAAAHPALASVVVDKQRTLFDLEDCEVEFTEFVIGGEHLQTVALEAPEARPIETLLQRLRLDRMQNESYSVFLQRRLFTVAR
jgi:hypothetical protein